MKTFKTLALFLALSAAAVTVSAQAATDVNGPSIDGYAAASLSAASANSIEMYSAPTGKSCAVRNTCDLMDPVLLDAQTGEGADAGQPLPEPGRY